MSSVEEYYESLLARHYTWMRGDFDSRVRENRALFEESGVSPRKSGKALDLGCGSGFQSVALAQMGFEVVGVDSSAALLRELRSRAKNLPIHPVSGDMREARLYAEHGPFEVAVCMGDTITHLRSREEVAAVIRAVYESLEKGGHFFLQFRDLTHELEGVDRAIPVRSDDDRIMATFLEYEAEHVNVHDMIFVREPSGWAMHKSAYKKVRLGAKDTLGLMEKAGFGILDHSEREGFSTIIGVKTGSRE
ncbi:MAG: class I SAM-dependent methyltransferase [Rubrobacter sp.]|nr:class I SAM-dependent methyltransferase [Rubrobacter sp.]